MVFEALLLERRAVGFVLLLTASFVRGLAASEDLIAHVELRISSVKVPVEGCPAMAVVSVTTDEELISVSFNIKHDNSILDLKRVIIFDSAGTWGLSEVCFPIIYDGWGSVGCPLYCFSGPCLRIGPGVDIPIAGFIYESKHDLDLGASSLLEFFDLELPDDPDKPTYVYTEGYGLRPGTVNGTALIDDVSCERRFKRGDANGDKRIDIGDAVSILSYIFSGTKAEHLCLDAFDANDDGSIDVGDAIYVLNYLFGEGREPAAPFAEEGYDLSLDELSCR